MTLLSTSSRSLVDRAPAWCSGGHGFDSCRGLRIFLCPTLVSCWLIHLHISLPSLKFPIFINLSVIIVIQLFHNVNWTRTITNLPWPKMHFWLIYVIILSILDWLINMVNSHLVILFWNRLLLFFDTTSCTSNMITMVQFQWKLIIIHFRIYKLSV